MHPSQKSRTIMSATVSPAKARRLQHSFETHATKRRPQYVTEIGVTFKLRPSLLTPERPS